MSRADRSQQGVRYHLPRHRPAAPVLGLSAVVLVSLVGVQLALVGPEDGGPAVAGVSTRPEPAPSGPAPSGPAPSDPAPSEPAPSEPVTSEPVADEPAPSGPARGAEVALEFEVGTTDPGPTAVTALEGVVAELTADPASRVRVVGHAEPGNDPVLAEQLSLRRATAVADLLLARGVADGQVEVVAGGAVGQPGAAVNRQVTVSVRPG